MSQNMIEVRNARTHNLKGISVDIPKKKIVVFTGVSGSGKSSLVFDTIYKESQRQLIETFSSFARARLPKLSKPPVDEIKNISTAIVIDQKRMGSNLRSTVGTATEINTYLRLLFSRCGKPLIGPSFLFGFNHPLGMCPECKGLGKKIKIDVNRLIKWDLSIREGAIDHPDHRVGGWNWRELIGINLFDTDKKLRDFREDELNELLYSDGIEIEKEHGASTYTKNYEGIISKLERLHLNKPVEDLSSSRKDAYQKYFVSTHCDACMGTRLNERARSVKIDGRNITDLMSMELSDLDDLILKVDGEIAKPIIGKIHGILTHLIDIGVGYLSLDRPVSTLSGGEGQRVKMARQLDCDLVDMMYVLDEPSIGLHPRDMSRMIEMLIQLKEKGNSVLVVEHDPSVMSRADHIIDIGPEAGRKGGNIIFSGTFNELKKTDGITSRYLKKEKPKKFERKRSEDRFRIRNASLHNLKDISTSIPKGILTCVTGVAGSGKSTLINEYFVKLNPGVILIDQSPVGRSSRSNPATYIGVFDDIRKEFARETGSKPSLFSFNSKGACPKCKGSGTLSVEMNFLDDVKIVCDECQGMRYRDEVMEMRVKGKTIFDVLEMTVREALEFFENRKINRKLQILIDVGLEYLQIGQPLSTLSGGECQRIKLASELHREGNVYIMDEPTTGLHMADIQKLMGIIEKIVENDNTVVVIEHNLDVIKEADWIIDLGPGGGKEGGEIIFEGIPEDLVKCEKSFTGEYLRDQIG